jgi:hypothetical protein
MEDGPAATVQRGPPLSTWLRDRWMLVLLASAIVAFAARWPLVHVPIYGDEAGMFYFSRHLHQDAQNVHEFDSGQALQTAMFFWHRPLFRLLFAPGAWISFHAYRVEFIAFSALLAPLTLMLLQTLAVRRWLILVGGTAAAAYPLFVHWSSIAFPDTPMLVAFVGALLAHERRRTSLAAALFVASLWFKETAIVGLGAFLVLHMVSLVRSGARRWRASLRDPILAKYGAASILGLLPLAVYMVLGGHRPGWSSGINGRELPGALLPSLWVLPLIVVGLRWARTRFYAIVALAYMCFYLALTWVLHTWVQDWYQVQPVFLGLVAALLVLDEILRRVAETGARRTFASAVVILVIAIQIFVPASWPLKQAATNPWGHPAQPSLAETYRRDHYFDAVADLEAHLGGTDHRAVFTIDLPLFYVLYPLAENSADVRWSYTDHNFTRRTEIARYTNLMDGTANVTVLQTSKTDHPLNIALRTAYSDCVDYRNSDFVLMHGQRCPGRLQRVVDEYETRTGTHLA